MVIFRGTNLFKRHNSLSILRLTVFVLLGCFGVFNFDALLAQAPSRNNTIMFSIESGLSSNFSTETSHSGGVNNLNYRLKSYNSLYLGFGAAVRKNIFEYRIRLQRVGIGSFLNFDVTSNLHEPILYYIIVYRPCYKITPSFGKSAEWRNFQFGCHIGAGIYLFKNLNSRFETKIYGDTSTVLIIDLESKSIKNTIINPFIELSLGYKLKISSKIKLQIDYCPWFSYGKNTLFDTDVVFNKGNQQFKSQIKNSGTMFTHCIRLSMILNKNYKNNEQ